MTPIIAVTAKSTVRPPGTLSGERCQLNNATMRLSEIMPTPANRHVPCTDLWNSSSTTIRRSMMPWSYE